MSQAIEAPLGLFVREPATRFAVIATKGRPAILADAVQSIRSQVDVVIVINNDANSQLDPHPGDDIYIIHSPRKEDELPNLSALWNIGLDAAYAMISASCQKWNVAILNDDAIVPPGWFDAVSLAMRRFEAAAACSDSTGNLREPMLHITPGPVGLATRMVGWAHMLAGEKRLRYDEKLQWWYGDDDMDWRSREAGGMVMIPGFVVANRFPNGQFTAELHEQAGRDRETFMRKWNGLTPW